MAGVTPTTITPTSLASFQQPTQFNPGQDPSKLFGKDFDKHLGNMQGKHKPEPKHKAEPQHKAEPKKTESKDHGHDSAKHHKHQPQHTHQPAGQ